MKPASRSSLTGNSACSNRDVYENRSIYGITETLKNSSSTEDIPNNMALNQILSGPSAKGKKCNIIDKAVAITTGFSSDYISNKKQFDDLLKQGQIEFATFHQNYFCEDFITGILQHWSVANRRSNCVLNNT